MNWTNILESTLGNIFSDLIVGSLITIFITKFLEILSGIRSSIGTLVLIDAEIQINRMILENMRDEMITAFENEMKRGKPDEIALDEKTFEDAAEFFKIPAEGLLQDAFINNYSTLGAMENKRLLEKILNFYTVGLHYRIKTSFRMGQLNWPLIDSIKERLTTEINTSNEIANEIQEELKTLRNKNIYRETLKELYRILKTGKLKK